jgi:hypothetical protein
MIITSVFGWLLSHMIAHRAKKAKRATEYVAIGTAQGHIMLWDCSRGEVCFDLLHHSAALFYRGV